MITYDRGRGSTYNESANRPIPAIEHPEGPRSEPTVAIYSRLREDFLFQQLLQDCAIIPFVYASNRDTKLDIVQLIATNVDGILQVSSKEKECRCILCPSLASTVEEWNPQRLTEPAFAEQSICVLKCSSSPPSFLEVVCQKSLCSGLLLTPPCHSPKTYQYILLSERKVVETAVNGVLLVRFCVLVACNDLELLSLCIRVSYIGQARAKTGPHTYQCGQI